MTVYLGVQLLCVAIFSRHQTQTKFAGESNWRRARKGKSIVLTSQKYVLNKFQNYNYSQVRIHWCCDMTWAVLRGLACRNYTGDILNFGLAKEHYAASHPDKIDNIKFVIVGDDVAVGRTQGSIVGRR